MTKDLPGLSGSWEVVPALPEGEVRGSAVWAVSVDLLSVGEDGEGQA